MLVAEGQELKDVLPKNSYPRSKQPYEPKTQRTMTTSWKQPVKFSEGKVDLSKLLAKYKMSIDPRFDGTTGFIYFEGGRAFFAVDKDGELGVSESWGEPTQKQAQRIFEVLGAHIESLKTVSAEETVT